MRIAQMSNSIGMSSLYLNNTTNNMNKSAKRIASGKKLNTDLVGEMGKLSTLKGHRNTINVETSNLKDAKSYVDTKDGALAQITELAQKINETYAKGTLDEADEAAVTQYSSEITNILKNTSYNGQDVFDKDDVSIGSITISKTSLLKSDGSSALDFTDAQKASDSLNSILSETATNGAISNGIDARISINTNTLSNLDDAISRIEDVDITEENLKYNQLAIQQQISAAMISKMQDSQSSILNFLI